MGNDEKKTVDTGGGAYVEGNVTAGGDFIGRDKIVHGDVIHGDKVGGDKVDGDKITFQGNVDANAATVGREASATVTKGIGSEEVTAILAPITKAIKQNASTAAEKQRALADIDELKAELSKGRDADDTSVASILDGIVGLVPGTSGAIVNAFGTPFLGGVAGPVTQYALDRFRKMAG